MTPSRCLNSKEDSDAPLHDLTPSVPQSETAELPATVVVSSAGTILWCSDSLAPVLGYAAYDLWGHGVLELMAPGDAAEFESELARLDSALSGAIRIRLRLRHADGSMRIAVGTATQIDGGTAGWNYLLRVRTVHREEESVASNDTASFFSRVRWS